MTAIDRGRAQRWHDTDHGDLRGPPLRRSRFIKLTKDPYPKPVSACYCCCEQCDPRWEHPRPNPFWSRAQFET